MKKITITNASKIEGIVAPQFRLDHLEVEGTEQMEASDGYHTFGELYEHRVALYIAICKRVRSGDLVRRVDGHGYENPVWRSRLHADGSSFDGWFILGIRKEPGKQITYHLPMERWSDTSFAETLEKAPEWDGHTPDDVLQRLKTL